MYAVIDYGMGNLRSVAKALEHVCGKQRIVVTSDAATIDAAERVVLPGQGGLPDCMRHLREAGLEAAVRRALVTKPVLAICVGEQMLFDQSEESHGAAPSPGLGVFAGTVRRFRPAADRERGGARLKVPHMGWNRVHQTRPHPLWEGIAADAFFYFAHSYYVAPADPALVVGESEYGARFTCAVARDNIFATQFHPAKSAARGLGLYENFCRWNP
jgi:glutamine amidotransferase